MAINKKLIHFEKKQTFNNELAKGNILGTSIVFIQDAQQIWTHGQFYDASTIDLSNIEESIQNLTNNKVDKVSGKGLSTNDYTTTEKNKLKGIEENANNYVLPSATTTVKGGVVIGDNIDISSGKISITSDNVVSALGYSPATKTLASYNNPGIVTIGNIQALPNGEASAGSTTGGQAAAADHVHPLQTTISGNAGTATTLKTGRTISLSGDATGTSDAFDGSKNITIPVTINNDSHSHSNSSITSLDASKITSGTIDIARLPKAAIPRLVIVSTFDDMLELTISDVQLGDTIKVEDTGLMYYVKDDSKLNSFEGYEIYTAGAASSVPWEGIMGKPSNFNPISHTHAVSDITSGTLPITRGGTGVTSNPSLLVNLASNAADTVFEASPRPGVTGVLSAANGGTGKTSLSESTNALINSLNTEAKAPVDNDYVVIQSSNGGTTNTNYYRKSISYIYDYLKPKTDSLYLGKTATAAAANKLATSRTITLTGAITGSGEFDGGDNLTINATVNHNYAGSSSKGGAATSADKLNTDAGSANNPVYFANGVPVKCTHKLNKTVPSNAVFTDTHYTTGIRVGASGTNSNAAVTDPYIKVLDNTTYRSQIQLKGNGATTVSSDANGVVTITSNNMVGATSSAAGNSGLVPAPAAGNQGKYLKGDGTWDTPKDTTYSTMTQNEATTGTSNTGKLITANILSTTISDKISGKLDINTASSTYATKTEVTNGLANKVNIVSGKGLSTNDYTTDEKNKLGSIAEGAEVNVQSDWDVTDTNSDAYIKNKPSLAEVATSGSYNSLTNKPTIDTALSTTSTNAVQNKAITAGINAKYTKPSAGIPKTDLASAVKTSLGKADTALQVETDPVFSASAAATITDEDIENWNSKTSNTGTVTGVKMNGSTKNPSNGVVDLGTIITAHQDISGKLDETTAANTYATKAELSSKYAFAKVSDGTTTITADTTDDTLTVAAGSGASIALDSTNDKLTISHSDTSTLSGAYGPTANVTGSNNATIVVPQITVDGFGHVTGVTNRTYTSKDTDTKVTSVDNHYTPAEDTTAAINASEGSATNITGTGGKLNVVTGLKRDAKGHIVGVTSANIYSTDNNTKYSAITADELSTGTATTSRTVTAKVLNAYISGKVSDLVDSAPDTLNTLNELAAALGDDPNFATTMSTALGKKSEKAFANITVGTTTVAADSKEDTLTLVAGSNVTITPDATNDKITIAAADTWRSITDSVSTTSSSTGASATAVKTAYDKAVSAYNLANGKTSNTGTVTKISTGKGLTGGDITSQGTIKANLNSETSLGTIGTTSKLYAVGVDANNKLCVSVPWTDTNTTYSLSSLGIGNVKNYDQSKAIKAITRSGTTFTYTCLDGTTGTFTQRDNNTTYGEATTSAAGLMSASDKSKLNGIASGATAVSSSTVSNWGFTKNTGTVTSVKVGSTKYDPDSGVVSLPAYPTSLPASDVYSWAKASSKPSYTYSEVGAAPASHNHDNDYYTYNTSRTANTVLAAPNGSNGNASFRTLVAADIPTLAISKISGLQDALNGKSSTDTKNTAGSTNSTSKLFIIGATSQAASPQTYSNSGVYTQSGSLYATHFYETSDKRFKTNIESLLSSDNCPVVRQFDWKVDGSRSYGFIAQELEEQGYKELVDTDEEGKKTVNYSAALSLTVGKLQKKIEELELKILELESKLSNN